MCTGVHISVHSGTCASVSFFIFLSHACFLTFKKWLGKRGALEMFVFRLGRFRDWVEMDQELMLEC